MAEERTLTLEEFSERILTPMLLVVFGLPDTEAGRAALDVLVEDALANG